MRHIILLITLALTGCHPSDESKVLQSSPSFEPQIFESLHTNAFHRLSDSDGDRIPDFYEVFGVVAKCSDFGQFCDLLPVAVRVPQKSFIEDICNADSYKGAADDSFQEAYQAVCSGGSSDLVTPPEDDFPFYAVRVGLILDLTGEVEPFTKTDELLIRLKEYPKDSRDSYHILNPYDRDSDGDSLFDDSELRMEPVPSEIEVEGVPLSRIDERLSLVHSPGDRPGVTAVPELRMIVDHVEATPDVAISESESVNSSLSSSTTLSGGMSIGYQAAFEVGASLFGPLASTTHTLSVSSHWDKSNTEASQVGDSQTLSRSSSLAKYALVQMGGFFVNIGTAPITFGTVHVPVRIANRDLGNITFKQKWNATHINATPGAVREFSIGMDDAPTMTRDQFGLYSLGMPIEFGMNIQDGTVFQNIFEDGILKDFPISYLQLSDNTDKRVARILLTQPFQKEGRVYPLNYAYNVFVGGQRVSGEHVRDVTLPLVPVTLKDALVAAVDFKEVYRDGQFLWSIKSVEYPQEQVVFVVEHQVGSGNYFRPPWLAESEGKQERNIALKEILRPGDKVYIKILDESVVKTEIKRALLVEDEDGDSVIRTVVQGQDVRRVWYEVDGDSEEYDLDSPDPKNTVALYEKELPAEFEGKVTVFAKSGDDTVSRELLKVIETAGYQPPQTETIYGDARIHESPFSEDSTVLLKSFFFDFAGNMQRPLNRIGVFKRKDYHINFNDWNLDDIFSFRIDLTSLDPSYEIETFTMEETCNTHTCQFPLDLGKLGGDAAFVLQGFDLTLRDGQDREIREIKIMPDGAHINVRFMSDRAHSGFQVKLQYAWLPETLADQETVTVGGIQKESSEASIQNPSSLVLQGFIFRNVDSDRPVDELGFELGMEQESITTSLNDSNNDDKFWWQTKFVRLKI